MHSDLDAPFTVALDRQLAERRLATGLQFQTCERMLPTLGPGPPADLEEARRILRDGTISKPPTAGSTDGTIISARRGRPRKGAERGTISAAKPWQAEGISRRTWYRRQMKKGAAG
jgi:hypothetical protein